MHRLVLVELLSKSALYSDLISSMRNHCNGIFLQVELIESKFPSLRLKYIFAIKPSTIIYNIMFEISSSYSLYHFKTPLTK